MDNLIILKEIKQFLQKEFADNINLVMDSHELRSVFLGEDEANVTCRLLTNRMFEWLY